MPRIDQVHSSKHNPDDRYHIYTAECGSIPQIEELCVCAEQKPRQLCRLCGAEAKGEIDRQMGS